MKRLTVVIGVLGLFALSSGVANAHMTDAQLARRAFLSSVYGDLQYRFWVECPLNETGELVVRVRQGTEVVSTSGHVECTGDKLIGVPTFQNTEFHLGPARSSMRVEFADGNVYTNSREVNIVPD